MFYVGKCCPFKVTDKVRRDTEDTAYLVHLVFSRFQELRVFGCDTYGMVLHSLFKHRHLMAVSRSLIHLIPRLSEFFGVFERAGVFQHTARSCSVAEELRPILFRCQGESDRFSCLRYGAQAFHSVYGHRFDVEDLVWSVDIGLVGYIVRIGVLNLACSAVAFHYHLIWFQIPQFSRMTLLSDDSCVCVAPQKERCHHRFPELEARHLFVRKLIKARKKRMLLRHFVFSVLPLFV